jgi:hypothetical protein
VDFTVRFEYDNKLFDKTPDPKYSLKYNSSREKVITAIKRVLTVGLGCDHELFDESYKPRIHQIITATHLYITTNLKGNITGV